METTAFKYATTRGFEGKTYCRRSELSYLRHQWSFKESINPYCFMFENICKG